MDKKNIMFFDLESIPHPDIPDHLRPQCKTGNTTDPEKLAKKRQKYAESGQIKEMSLNPAMNMIVALEMWTTRTNGFIPTPAIGDERGLLENFWREAEKTQLFVGFNILNFDLPTILFRSMMHRINRPRDISLKRYSTKPVFDEMQMLCGWDVKKAKNCDWYLKRFNLTSKIADGSQVYGMWQRQEFDQIKKYCIQDVLSEKELYYYMEHYYVPFRYY